MSEWAAEIQREKDGKCAVWHKKLFFFFSGHLMQTEEASESNKFVQGFSLLRGQENNSFLH